MSNKKALLAYGLSVIALGAWLWVAQDYAMINQYVYDQKNTNTKEGTKVGF